MNNILLLTLLSPMLLFGNSKIDSLKMEINEKDGIEKIKIFLQISNEYLSFDADSTLFYAKESFELSKFFSDETLNASSTYLMGRAYINKEDNENAFKNIKLALELFKKNENTKKYLLSLFYLGIICHRRSQYGAALEYYKLMLKISETINDNEWIATALDGIGTMYYLIGKYKFALSYLDSSFKEYKKLNIDDNNARLFYGMGAVHMTTADYDKALDYLLKSINTASEKNNFLDLAMGNHAIGVIYYKLKNFHLSIEFNNKALKFAEEINNKYLIGNFLSHSGEVFLQLSQIDTALIIAKDALKVLESINNKVGIARSLDLLGDIYLKKHEYEQALNNYSKAWQFIMNIDEKYRKTKIIYHLGLINIKLEQFDIAKIHLDKSLNDAKKIGAQDLVQDNLNTLAEYYARLHDYKKAYQYLMEFTHLSDSIFTTSSNNIAEMQMRYETGKREKENELLKSKLDIQNLELDKSNLKYWLSSLSLVIVSIIGFFSYYRYSVKKRANIILEKKIKNALYKQQEQQEIIFHQANLSSLGELSAGMAHEINQPLQGIKLSTEALDLDIQSLIEENSVLKENIVEIYQGVDRIKNIIDHVRIFASQQKNHIDEYFSISTVIENALSLVGKQYLKIGIMVQIKLDEKIGRIKGNPFKYEQVVFNLLSNAKDALLEKETKMNQSFDKEINLRTYRDETDIVFEVQDNGIGMTVEQKDNIFNPFFTTKNLGVGTGLGLSIVFGIVKEMKGKIHVESEYNRGTTVYIRIPSAV